MKKIVALVLSLVMVLGLAVTAMAADTDTYDVYFADKDLAATMLTGVGDQHDDAVVVDNAAVTYTNGSGVIAHVVVAGVYYTKITAAEATTSDFVLASDDGKTIISYLRWLGDDANVVKYIAKATEFKNFSLAPKCGYLTVQAMPAPGTVYFETAAGAVYLAAAASTTEANNYLVGNTIYSTNGLQTVQDHTFTVSNAKYDTVTGASIPTEATCSVCFTPSTAIYANNKIPAGKDAYPITGTNFSVVLGATASTPAVDGEKVESAETFDAGIAMYVGMSVMAAAGSAVVLKKKD